MEEIKIKSRNSILFCVDKVRFEKSLRYTISYDKKPYNKIVKNGYSNISELKKIFKKAQVPFPVLFMNDDDFNRNLNEYIHHTFSGVARRTYSIATNGNIDISQIAILLKHISSLQHYISRDLPLNDVIGAFCNLNNGIKELADKAREIISFDLNEYYSKKRKEDAFRYFENKLNSKNIFVSVYDHELCAQTINLKEFAGIFINHKKAPYLFIRASDDKSSVELWGRRILIAALLFWFLLNKINKPIAFDMKHMSDIDDRAYLFAEEFLMPSEFFLKDKINNYEDIKKLGDEYKVSPSAIIMRASRLNMISEEEKKYFFEQRDADFKSQRDKQGYNKNRIVEKSIVKNVGHKATEIIMEKLDANLIEKKIAKHLLSPRKGSNFNFDEIKRYISE